MSTNVFAQSISLLLVSYCCPYLHFPGPGEQDHLSYVHWLLGLISLYVTLAICMGSYLCLNALYIWTSIHFVIYVEMLYFPFINLPFSFIYGIFWHTKAF